jgi:DNA-binding beta-propeller fold protein YncE
MRQSTLSGSKNRWLRAWWLLAPLFMVACGSGGSGEHLASDPGTSQQRATSLPPVTGAARNFAYALSNDAANRGVSTYAIDPTSGALKAVGVPVAAGDNPVSAAATPGGKFLYVANSRSDNVTAYHITPATGTLNPLGSVAAGSNPQSIAVHPGGTAVYVANFNSNTISAYTIGATGALTPIGTPIATGTNPIAIAMHPGGKFAYAANPGSDNLRV